MSDEACGRGCREGVDPAAVDAALRKSRCSPRAIALDRGSSSVRLGFETFHARRTSNDMRRCGRAFIRENMARLDGIEAYYLGPVELLVAIWALQSSFGRFQGERGPPDARHPLRSMLNSGAGDGYLTSARGSKGQA